MKNYKLGERQRYVPEQVAGGILAIGLGVALGLWLGLWVVSNFMLRAEARPMGAYVRQEVELCDYPQRIDTRLACEALEKFSSTPEPVTIQGYMPEPISIQETNKVNGLAIE